MRCGACGRRGHRKNSPTCPEWTPPDQTDDDTRLLVVEAWDSVGHGEIEFTSMRNLARELGLPWATFHRHTLGLWRTGQLQSLGQLNVFARMLASDRQVTTRVVETDGEVVETVTTTKHGMPVAAGRLVHDIAEATTPDVVENEDRNREPDNYDLLERLAEDAEQIRKRLGTDASAD